MDRLPDELLLIIFGGIEDGQLMLDLSLVSKRFRRVSRDPRAWAGVRLQVPCFNGEASTTVQHARVLRHAPALRALILKRCVNFYSSPTLSLGTALAVCTQPLSELRLGALGEPGSQWTYSTRDALMLTQPMVQLLRRNNATLRAVSVSLRGKRDVQQEALEALASMSSLVDLSMEISCASSQLHYKGELEGRLCGLRRLAFGVEKSSTEDQGRILRDLLLGASQSLREVRLAPSVSLSRATKQALRGCAGLRVLAANVYGVPVVGEMPALRELCVDVSSGQELSACARAAKAAAAAPLDQLRGLKVVVHRLSQGLEVGRLLAALMRAAPGLTSVDVKCTSAQAAAMEADVAAALGGLLHLEEARFEEGGCAVFHALAGLPALRRVHGHFRVSAAEMHQCCAVVESWRARASRPMGLTLKLTPIPIEPKIFRL